MCPRSSGGRGTFPPAVYRNGINLLPLLTGQSPPVERTLFWRTDAGGRAQAAARKGDWKLLVDGTHTMSFNVGTDLQERQNVAAPQPAKARELWMELQRWSTAVSLEAKSRQ